MTFWYLQSVFKKSNIGWPQQPRTEKISDTSKKLDFWWSIQQKTLVLVILVPGMIQPSGSGSSWMKWGCWGHWGHRGCWGCWGHWGCRGSKAWKITTEGFRLIQVLELSFIYIFLGKKSLVETWSIKLDLSTFSVWGCWGQPILLF